MFMIGMEGEREREQRSHGRKRQENNSKKLIKIEKKSSKLPVSLFEPSPENIPKGDSAVKQAPTPRPRPDIMEGGIKS